MIRCNFCGKDFYDYLVVTSPDELNPRTSICFDCLEDAVESVVNKWQEIKDEILQAKAVVQLTAEKETGR